MGTKETITHTLPNELTITHSKKKSNLTFVCIFSLFLYHSEVGTNCNFPAAGLGDRVLTIIAPPESVKLSAHPWLC